MKILCILLISFNLFAKSDYSTTRLNRLSGEKSFKYNAKSEWDQAYARKSYIFGKSPAKFLAENFAYFSSNSKILDMGMGEGRNAVFLAQKGHKVMGIDISSVAIKKANKLAKEFGVRIKSVLASLDSYKIEKESLDGLICFYYVDRKLIPKMISWLRPGGILIYEGDSILQKNQKGQQTYSEEQYLKQGELLTLFPKTMRILKYEEPIHEKKIQIKRNPSKEDPLMGKFISTKNFKGYPCTHRQWRADSHCRFVHGYSREFYFEFECSELTPEMWVMDFGGLKEVKSWLDHMFDHTFLVSEDDPELKNFKELDEKGVIQIRILPNAGMEGTAQYVYEEVTPIISKLTNSRVKIIKVEVRENEKNSAIYIPK